MVTLSYCIECPVFIQCSVKADWEKYSYLMSRWCSYYFVFLCFALFASTHTSSPVILTWYVFSYNLLLLTSFAPNPFCSFASQFLPIQWFCFSCFTLTLVFFHFRPSLVPPPLALAIIPSSRFFKLFCIFISSHSLICFAFALTPFRSCSSLTLSPLSIPIYKPTQYNHVIR